MMDRRPLSQLFSTRFQDPAPDDSAPTVITLHGHNQFGRDLESLARAAAPTGRLLGLESYKGVFVGREIVGYTWFLGPETSPAPVFFGDALAEIERFLWDERDRDVRGDGTLPYLLGVDQGAIMAIAAGLVVPDLLSGVIAIRGSLPLIPGWEPPLAPLAGLPVLLLDAADASPAAPRVLHGDALVDQLAAWDADVTRVVVAADRAPGDAIAPWLRGRSSRHIADG